MKDDFYIMYLLRYKKRLSYRDRLFLWWLDKNYPSYEETDEIKEELYKRKYIVDLSGWESEFIQERAEWTGRPKEKPEVIQTSELGEKAIYSKELKSELIEEFFDKTLVRWGLLISGGYGLISFFVDVFDYFKN